MRPNAARNEVNFCAEMLGTLPLAVDVLEAPAAPPAVDVLEAPAALLTVGVLEAPAALLDVWEPPVEAVLVGATPLAAARKAS